MRQDQPVGGLLEGETHRLAEDRRGDHSVYSLVFRAYFLALAHTARLAGARRPQASYAAPRRTASGAGRRPTKPWRSSRPPSISPEVPTIASSPTASKARPCGTSSATSAVPSRRAST